MARLMRTIGLFTAAAIVATARFGPQEACADVFTWTNADSSSTWNDSSAWSPSTAYPGTGSSQPDYAYFPPGLSGNVNLTTAVTAGTIELDNASTSSAINITGASTLNLSDSGLIQLDNIANGSFNDTISAPLNMLGSGTLATYNGSFGGNQSLGNLQISGPITGSGVLTITTTNTGMVYLTGGNTGFTGTMNIVGPTVAAPQNRFAGLYQSGTSFGNAAAVTWTNGDWQGITNGTTAPQIINAGGTYWTAYGGNTTNMSVTVNSGGTLELDTGGGNTCVYGGAFGGPGEIITNGNNDGNAVSPSWQDNIFSGAGANTLSGTVLVQQGKLQLDKTSGVNAIGTAAVNVGASGHGSAAVLWSASNQINGGSVFTLYSGASSNGQLWLQGQSDTIAGLQDTGGAGTALVQDQYASGFAAASSTSGNELADRKPRRWQQLHLRRHHP